MQIAIMQKDNLDILQLHNAMVTLNSRVATKILRRFSVGLVKESIIKGRTLTSIYAERRCLGLLKPNVLCMSMLRSMVITDQLGFQQEESFLEGGGSCQNLRRSS